MPEHRACRPKLPNHHSRAVRVNEPERCSTTHTPALCLGERSSGEAKPAQRRARSNKFLFGTSPTIKRGSIAGHLNSLRGKRAATSQARPSHHVEKRATKQPRASVSLASPHLGSSGHPTLSPYQIEGHKHTSFFSGASPTMKPRSIAGHLVSLKASTPQLHKLGRFTTSKNEQQNNHRKRRVGKPTSTTRLDTPLSLPSQIEGRGRTSVPSQPMGRVASAASSTPLGTSLGRAAVRSWRLDYPTQAHASQHVTIADPTPQPMQRPRPKNAHRRWQCSSLGPPAHASGRKPKATGNIATSRTQRGSCRAPRHPTPPHHARSAATSPAPHRPPRGAPRLARSTATSRTRRGSCRTPEGIRPRPIVHVPPPHRSPSPGLQADARGLQATPQHPTPDKVHAARPKAPGPTPPCTFSRRVARPPRASDRHAHAPSICPCAAHCAWGVGVAT